ncbi:MAG: hypothetical protein PHH64_07595 [Proteiniphilum sp.]|nr:hypothetical protein [Proteiniphilum sp.]MDD4159255.1 hypothetical protein [Proteiniphilum sp.]MDD4799628.1 hypothetical protein [Proteiniphilum sp.]
MKEYDIILGESLNAGEIYIDLSGETPTAYECVPTLLILLFPERPVVTIMDSHGRPVCVIRNIPLDIILERCKEQHFQLRVCDEYIRIRKSVWKG